MKKPFPTRPLSWSQISSFQYNPSAWYSRYVLGEEQPESPEMRFGKEVGERLASDPTYLPEVERAIIFEQELHGKIDDIELIGFLDSFCPDKKILLEYKTSRNKKKWNHKSASLHGQLDFYAFLIYQNYKIKPEDLNIKLIYVPVHIKDGELALCDDPINSFEVKKTMTDILRFANYIKDVRKEMEEFYRVQTHIYDTDFFAK